MTDLNISVLNNSNDAYEADDNTGYSTASGVNTIIAEASTTASVRKNAAMRFAGVTIQPKAVIHTAVVRIKVPASKTTDDPELDILAEAADNPANFVDNADVTGRTRGTQSVSWSATDIGTGATVDSPDIKSVIQEVIDRAGWVGGFALVVFFDGKNAASKILEIAAFPHATDPEAQLRITYLDPISPTGIASSEAFGTGSLQLQIQPAGIASGEQFGTASLQLQIQPTGIPSAEAHGTGSLQIQVQPAGIPSAEAHGTGSLQIQVEPAGIASQEAFGTGSAQIQVQPAGIPTGEAFGTASAQLQIQPAGIPTAEAFGTGSLQPQVALAGIATGEAFGSPTLIALVALTGIPSGEAFGLLHVALVTLTGIPSGEAFGTLTIGGTVRNLGLTVGAPVTKWSPYGPAAKWSRAGPTGKWAGGPPTV